MLGRDHAESGGTDIVAADAESICRAAIHRFGAEANVGSNRVKSGHSAAVDDHGNFRSKPRGQRSARQRAAQIGGESAGVEDFCCGDTS